MDKFEKELLTIRTMEMLIKDGNIVLALNVARLVYGVNYLEAIKIVDKVNGIIKMEL